MIIQIMDIPKIIPNLIGMRLNGMRNIHMGILSIIAWILIHHFRNNKKNIERNLRMRVFECNECNNSYFLRAIINDMKLDETRYNWVISDLDLVPVFKGDYSGIGAEETQSVAYEFLKKIEREKISIINSRKLYSILEDTRTINNGVFICIEKEYNINVDTYRPIVECNKPNEMYDTRAEYEIRILERELFFVLEKKRKSTN